MKLNEFFNSNKKEQSEIIKIIDKFLKKNISDPESDQVFNLKHGYKLHYNSFPRGDVIELKKGSKVVAGWADQSRAYNGMMGKGDFEFSKDATLNLIKDLF